MELWWELTGNGHKGDFWGVDNVQYPDKSLVYAFVKSHCMGHLRLAHFTVCKFYLQKQQKNPPVNRY